MPTSSLHRFVCFVCVSFSPIALVASTIHVPLDQPTIQQAIGVAVNGDIVLVSPGTYKENIDFKGKAITVQSSNGPAGTMIDGGEKGPAVTFATNEGKTSVLTGFTIRNGSNANGAFAGGGISITQASPTISGNIITANSSCNNGAAIQSSGGSPVIRNNLISGNFQAPFCFGDAGSVLIGSGTGVQLVGNVISGNPAGGVLLLDPQGSVLAEGNMITNNSGAGITWRNEFSAGGPVTLVQNLVAGNEGTGVSWDLGPIVLVNNTIANNAANFNSNASEIFASVMNNQVTMVNNLVVGAINASTIYCVNFDSTKRPIFNNNDIFSAAALAYAGTCPDLTGTNGNLSADPLFRAILSDNYHLLAGSPAIDAGSNSAPDLPSTDFDGDARIINNVVDIGVDEFSTTTRLVFSVSELRFASQQQGSTSLPKTVTLTNFGSTSVSINLVATGADFLQTNNCSHSLAAGALCTISVKFSPQGGGVRDSALGVFTNATLNPLVVSLSGVGLAPALTLTPTFLYFQNSIIGTTSTQTAKITNTGQAPLVISSILPTGNSDFTVSSNCPAKLAIAASCNLTVTWTPSVVAFEQGTITISDNAPGSPHTINTIGQSFSAGIPTLSTTSLTFPITLVATTSGVHTVTLTNTGTGNLGNISTFSAFDFPTTNNCPAALAPQARCTISIKFTPYASGVETGFVEVFNDSPKQPQITVSGTGKAPVPTIVSISQSSAPAGSADLQLTITGTGFFGQSQIMWNSTPLFAYFTTPTQISLNVPASELAAAGSVRVTVVNPAPGGVSNAISFVIYTPVNYAVKNVAYAYQTITGTNLKLGFDDSASITSPFAIQFGGGSFTKLTISSGGTISFSGFTGFFNSPIPYNQTSTLIAPFWATLFSWGTGTNNNVFWSVIGTAPNRSLVVEWRNVAICCIIDPLDTVKFQVVFFEGSGNVRFNYADTVFGGPASVNDNGATATVGVQVTQALGRQFSFNQPLLKSQSSLLWYPIIPSVALSTSTLDFGYHQIGTASNSQKLTLTNASLDLLQISSIVSSSPDFAETNNCGTSLGSGKSCVIMVTFNPSQPVAESATLTINDNTVAGSQTVTLNGTGSIQPIVVFPIQLTFGTVSVGTSRTLPVTLANGANQPLTIQTITVSPGQFTQSNNCGTSLMPGASCTINVTFAPASTGSASGSLSMGLNSQPASTQVKMSGSGF